jgi:hypothetical protein
MDSPWSFSMRRWWIALLFAPSLAGCVGASMPANHTRWGLWPLLAVTRGNEPVGDPPTRELDVRALIVVNYHRGADTRKFALWPPIDFTREGDRTSGRIFPIVWSGGEEEKSFGVLPLYYRSVGESHRTLWILPFLWRRGATEDQRAFHFVPFFTNSRGGPENRAIAVRPFFRIVRSPEFQSTDILLHLLSFQRRGEERTGSIFLVKWKGGGGEKSFTVFPFYHHSVKGPDRTRWIFPLLWRSGATEEEGAFFAFPLYFSWRGGASRVVFPSFYRLDDGRSIGAIPLFTHASMTDAAPARTTVLFPLYHSMSDGDYARWDVLWPSIGWGGDGGANSHLKIAPLGGLRRIAIEEPGGRASERSWWLLGPLMSSRRTETDFPELLPDPADLNRRIEGRVQTRSTEFDSLLVFSMERDEAEFRSGGLRVDAESEPEGEYRGSRVSLFPLVRFERREESNRIWQAESKRSIREIFPLFSIQRHNDRRALSLLWPVYTQDLSPRQRIRSFLTPALVDLANDPEAREDDAPPISRVRALLGLIRFGADDRGRYVSLFYLPAFRWGVERAPSEEKDG